MSRSDIILKTQDLSYLSWDEHDAPSGLGGVAPKAREGRGSNAVYYKRSRAGSLGEGNRDLIVQLVGTRLASVLGFDHLSFQLVRAQLAEDTRPEWIARSKSYRLQTERALNLTDYLELCGDLRETPFEFFCRMGWRTQAAQIMFFDYLTAFRERDASDFEVLVGAGGSVRLSPIATCSRSLVNAFPLGLWRRDPLADVSSASFLDLGSQEENLAFIAKTIGPLSKPRALRRSLIGNLDRCFDDSAFIDGCFEIVDARWDAYACVCSL